MKSPFRTPSAPVRARRPRRRRAGRAFTLIELLTVIAIIGILAAIALPNLRGFKPNTMAAGTRQLLDDLARARQMAIGQRTTVFMVFVPAQFWMDNPAYNNLTADDKSKAEKLWDKQLTGYSYVTLRSMGDQPGQPVKRYLSSTWRALPDGVFIYPAKFQAFNPVQPPVLKVFTNNSSGTPILVANVYGLRYTNTIPFPAETNYPPYISMPYIAFNYLGQLVDAQNQPTGMNEILPLGLGSVSYARDPNTRQPRQGPPNFTEMPIGNTTNNYNLISIDWLTGRARVERREVQ